MATRLFPNNIQHIGPELAISWNDDAETFLNLELLRRACPCAACGGEPDVLGNIDRPEVTSMVIYLLISLPSSGSATEVNAAYRPTHTRCTLTRERSRQ